MQNFDVVIIGGGMIGLVLACGLQKSAMRIAVIEQSSMDIAITNDPFRSFVIAVNSASVKLLESINIWSEIVHYVSCFHGIEVWDKDSFGQITFSDKSLGYSCLGYIVDDAVIRHALWCKVQKYGNIQLITSSRLQKIFWGENDVFITLDNGEMLTATLVVGADGANSWIRKKANIPLTWWNYQHHALVATVRTEKMHDFIVRQIFHHDGILAFLPLNDLNHCSIVWSLFPEKAHQMSIIKPKMFDQMLCIASDNHLGLCSLKSERRIFPLVGRYARRFAGHRLVLVGDAAHTIHPLAGQGVNLGFMDDAELIKELLQLHRKGKDIGQYLHLRRYERSRKYKAITLLIAIQGLYELFYGENLIKKSVRNIGLNLVDKLPVVKFQLLRQAMGLNDFPDCLF